MRLIPSLQTRLRDASSMTYPAIKFSTAFLEMPTGLEVSTTEVLFKVWQTIICLKSAVDNYFEKDPSGEKGATLDMMVAHGSDIPIRYLSHRQ